MTGKQSTRPSRNGLVPRAVAAKALGLSPRSVVTYANARGEQVPRWLQLAMKGLQTEHAEQAAARAAEAA